MCVCSAHHKKRKKTCILIYIYSYCLPWSHCFFVFFPRKTYTENNEKDNLINHVMCWAVILNHDLDKKREMEPNCKCIEDCVPQITNGYRKSMFSYRTPLFHPIVIMRLVLPLTYNMLRFYTFKLSFIPWLYSISHISISGRKHNILTLWCCDEENESKRSGTCCILISTQS